MNFKRKLQLLLISFVIIIPINVFAYTKYLIPGGENVGINIKADGVFIVGFYEVNGQNIAKEAGLKIGDRITHINDEMVTGVNELVNKINSHNQNITIKLTYIRNNKSYTTRLDLERENSGIYKTGIYVKDTITGIGTITYINPLDNTYGALGHEIIDASTNINFSLKEGTIFSSSITSIKKSIVGLPGEKNASLNFKKVFGDIKLNIITGIYGTLQENISKDKPVEVMNLSEVKIGKAEIITVLDGTKKETYEVEILSINQKSDTKNFLIKITDQNLIEKTGGIIKGMSGSPIMQNGKIIGAITHAIVDDPLKGYGISIIKMLESVE